MDARERLRRYLEQRRELGESELVLDGMAVDEVMTLLGARDAAKPPRGARSVVSAMAPPTPPVVQQTPAVPPPPTPTARFNEPVAGSNWRQTLRDAEGGSSAAPASDTSGVATPQAAVFPTWLTSLGIPSGLTVVERVDASITVDGLAETASLDDIARLVRDCTRCVLHASARHAVPGEGNPNAEVVCVGEAPGADEDEQGLPFVGAAGQLLTKILAAIQLGRDDVFICNVLKHRPPANRDPLPDEVTACQPFLRRQIATIKPRVILALGRFAAQTLLGTGTPLGKLRGQVHSYHGIPVITTYHPAALLRNEAWKRPTWDDLKVARTILDASRAADGRANES
jgi:DNA polymerase